MRRKILSVLLAGALVCSLAGCGGTQESSTSESESKSAESSEGTQDDTTDTSEEESEEESEAAVEQVLRVALNVYYNDQELNYYGNELSDVIEITEEGQYTLTFDCAENLSEDAIEAGVTGLNNLISIYIKDYDVTAGNISSSNVATCDIFYDSIVVDGQELTINQTEAKTGIKASGIFDTNDPVNSYDGSAVDETTTTDYVLNFTTVEDPQVITVTFTISNLSFK